MAVADWTGEARCVGRSDLFFGTEAEDTDLRSMRERAALSLCAACGIREPCLRFAVTNKIRDGVWGGLRDVERRGLREAGVAAAARSWSRGRLAPPMRQATQDRSTSAAAELS